MVWTHIHIIKFLCKKHCVCNVYWQSSSSFWWVHALWCQSETHLLSYDIQRWRTIRLFLGNLSSVKLVITLAPWQTVTLFMCRNRLISIDVPVVSPYAKISNHWSSFFYQYLHHQFYFDIQTVNYVITFVEKGTLDKFLST